ncbi:MAG: molybdenum cofactor guanylyltransferase [Vulcanimicrobiaceae bacterium]
MTGLGILILAGGEATRLPGKLTLTDAADRPMIVRVYENLRRSGDGEREIVVSGKATFPREIDALVSVPLVIDRWPRRGPLAGMLTSFAAMRSRFVFAVAGDAPFVDAAFVDRLERIANADRAHVAGPANAVRAVEAYVPIRSRAGEPQLEPLAAMYDRLAFLREGLPVLRSGRGSLRAVIDRLRTRFVDDGERDDERVFTNVNTPADYAALRAQEHPHEPTP